MMVRAPVLIILLGILPQTAAELQNYIFYNKVRHSILTIYPCFIKYLYTEAYG